jgi:biopolymer transport protein ExbB
MNFSTLFSIFVAVVSCVFLVWLMQFLVSRDFYLTKFLGLTGTLPFTIVWAAAWVVAVMAITVGSVVYVLRLLRSGALTSWTLSSLWGQLGAVAKIVVIVLFIMLGWSIGVMIDRWLAFTAVRKDSRLFAPAVAQMLQKGQIDEAIELAQRHKKSHMAKVVNAGLIEFKSHENRPGESPSEAIEASKRALADTEAIVNNDLKRGLGYLATIGSIAPFVGLFGTVIGILTTFNGNAKEEATGLATVAGGIAEALVTTAVGMFVAIPAVMMFNYLNSRVEAFDVEMGNSSTELVDYLLKQRSIQKSHG